MKHIFNLFLVLLIPASSYSQRTEEVKVEKTPIYVGFSAGLGPSGFRDFATSPLYYNSIAKFGSLDLIRKGERRETVVGVSYSFGSYMTDFNSNPTQSEVKTLSAYYSELFQLKKLSNEKWNTKLGGEINVTANHRINGSLQNNAFGGEIIPTLLLSAKVTRDLSRKEAKSKKILFVNLDLKSRQRDVSVKFNTGVVNSSYRNGFVYISQSAATNNGDNSGGYEFNFFSGFRLSSAIDYSYYFKNNNVVQLSYLWDAYKTGGDFESFEMVRHTIKLSLLFNTNIR